MPYVHITTTEKLDFEGKEALHAKIAKLMPIIPGKTYDNTTIQIDDGCYMRKGDQRRIFVMDVHLFNPSPEESKKEFCETVMKLIEEDYGIPVKGQAINMIELPHWASSGTYR